MVYFIVDRLQIIFHIHQPKITEVVHVTVIPEMKWKYYNNYPEKQTIIISKIIVSYLGILEIPNTGFQS
jgi:hypothetical protein